MNIRENVPLSDFSTMRLGGPARYLIEVTTRFEAADAVVWADEQKMPVIMIGSGSNIVWVDAGFQGLVIVNKITGFEIQELDQDTSFVHAGGGETWDNVVGRTVEKGLSGIEMLSRIPGTAGAAPMQNIGAYGQQLSDVLVT